MSRQVVLAENIHAQAAEAFSKAGYGPLDRRNKAIADAELPAALAEAGLLGIRSRTQVRADALRAASALRAIGCFCIGVNQVDLETARSLGVPVFNAPFANARSVAELTMASAIHLMRRIPEKMFAVKRGEWLKTAEGAYEVRAKNLGIVGYGNIGSQLSVIASALGMHVYYFDIETKLRHGNARPVESLDALLEVADVVTLHVPSTPLTQGMIGAEQLAKMKPGAVLINYARGDLVDIDALAECLRAGRIAGAAIDVFPQEPKSADDRFESPLIGFDQVILSPHVGGSTQEAQRAIGGEVAEKLIKYDREASTAGAVNFPEVSLPPLAPRRLRVAHAHRNVPGVLGALNDLFSAAALNIAGQTLATLGEIGYAVTDLEGDPPADLCARAEAVAGSIRVRILKGGS
ncbi:MAG: phosphoglycerate dehydrogenase [Maricaulaceae bacterium]